MADLFQYTVEQSENIRRGLHPDCCLTEPCAFCGASEAVGGGACRGDIGGLVRELFDQASCSAHNANIKSIGQIVNWSMHDSHARAFDAAARALAIPSPAPEEFWRTSDGTMPTLVCENCGQRSPILTHGLCMGCEP